MLCILFNLLYAFSPAHTIVEHIQEQANIHIQNKTKYIYEEYMIVKQKCLYFQFIVFFFTANII